MNLSGDHTQAYFSRKRKLEDLLQSSGDDSGYVEGRVFMVWPPRNNAHRINLEVMQDKAVYRFEVELPLKDGIAFRPHERVCLSLKGVKVEQRQASSAPHSFPAVLRFPGGVALKYLSGANEGKVVDTWEPTGNADEWYSPGTVRTVSDMAANDASKARDGFVPPVALPPIPRTDVTSSHGQNVIADQSPSSAAIADGVAAAPSTHVAGQSCAETRGSSRRARKKRRLLKKERESNVAHATGIPLQANVPVADGPSACQDSEINDPRENPCSDTVIASEAASVPVQQFKAGFRTERGDVFTAISELQGGHALINVIGIVTHANPEVKTRSNEWCRSITVVDPSVVDSLRRSGIKVNCFQKKYPEWLPQAQENDIIILRKLKIKEYKGTISAVGYGDKLRWAVYDPLQQSIRPPNKGNAPEKQHVDDGFGYEYSPYWEPSDDSAELEYCRRVGEWWKAHKASIPTVVCSASVSKRHLLISEASPDLPPGGFFNCTVEVLQKFDNMGDATTVYVTDYTTSPLVHPMQATWCPPQLSEYVLQFSMWDAARSVAKMMNPGEYWYLHNVRARWNPNSRMEGTMQLAEKVTQLHETQLGTVPALKALLARKKDFQANNPGVTAASTSLHVFPEILLQDIEESTNFITCAVELLHVDLNSGEGRFLYATDYTYNPDLPTVVSSAEWARNLEHRVMKIRLDDAQAKISSDVRAGSMYTLQNVRVKRLNGAGVLYGSLGGNDPLIVPLHDSSGQAQTLQGNKDKWRRENMLDSPTLSDGPYQGPNEQGEPLSTVSDIFGTPTLEEALAWPAPAEFKVCARAVDFYPFALEDACALRCTKCNASPPPSFRQCPRCDDMTETHCEWAFCFYVLLRDERDNKLMASLSGKECPLLRDVAPADFRCDRDAFRKFLDKVDPVLGNLREVHAAWSKNEDKAVESPVLTVTLESWNVRGRDEKGYSVVDCRIGT